MKMFHQTLQTQNLWVRQASQLYTILQKTNQKQALLRIANHLPMAML
ncbi:hypothetical protein E2C01_052948 [Portunus trituberculatus]|uniref:Uncharacterized protein n=1 Tax=Portunus trituberculatus TaxID=210409 RepID=A0A5B7GN76_PORTR|nr:hypothetical protein [Portunus trituberculatus]